MITDWLFERYVKGTGLKKDETQLRTAAGLLEGKISLAVNLVLFIVKLSCGLFINSIALITDGLHSLSNVQSSVAVIWGFRLIHILPDEDHPYGHGRMEQITNLIVAIILIVSGFEFFRGSFQYLITPGIVRYSPRVILILILSLIINEWLARFSKKLSTKITSKTIHRDFISHRSDVITSVLVMLALFSDKINIPRIDGFIGICLSLYIIYTRGKVIQEIINPLLGESATLNDLQKIKRIALGTKDVKGVHDIMMHKYGDLKIISLHAEIDNSFSLFDAHELIEELEERINKEMCATTVAHIDPLFPVTEELKNVLSVLDDLVVSNKDISSYHDVRIVYVKDRPSIILDIVTSYGTPIINNSKIQNKVSKKLLKIFPNCIPKIWVEPQFNLNL